MVNEDEDGQFDFVTCPACGQEYVDRECRLGTLGNLTHYRCRGCGMGFSHAAPLSDPVVLEHIRKQELACGRGCCD